jgi:hypothetical protein
MRYIVSPGEGVGALRFGMSREDIHARLGEPDEQGEWPEIGETEDEWENDGIAVVFDADGACVEIALFPPATASVRGARLLGEADGDAGEALRGLDPECGEQDGIFIASALGLLYVVDEDGDPELLVTTPERLDALAAAPAGDEDEAGAKEEGA